MEIKRERRKREIKTRKRREKGRERERSRRYFRVSCRCRCDRRRSLAAKVPSGEVVRSGSGLRKVVRMATTSFPTTLTLGWSANPSVSDHRSSVLASRLRKTTEQGASKGERNKKMGRFDHATMKRSSSDVGQDVSANKTNGNVDFLVNIGCQ